MALSHLFRIPYIKRTLKLVFYYLPLALGATAIVVVPFLSFEVFHFAQLALAILFVGMLRLKIGLVDEDDDVRTREKLRLRDHAGLVAMMGLMAAMAVTAPERLFGLAWAFIAVFFIVFYGVLLSGWQPKARHQEHLEP